MGHLDTYVKAVKRGKKARRRPRSDDLTPSKGMPWPEDGVFPETSRGPVRGLLILEASEVEDLEAEVSRLKREEGLPENEARSKASKQLLQSKQVKQRLLRLPG